MYIKHKVPTKTMYEGILDENSIDQESIQFKYIQVLHKRLWEMVRHFYPGAQGELLDYLDMCRANFYNCTKTAESVREQVIEETSLEDL